MSVPDGHLFPQCRRSADKRPGRQPESRFVPASGEMNKNTFCSDPRYARKVEERFEEGRRRRREGGGGGKDGGGKEAEEGRRRRREDGVETVPFFTTHVK
ncbi:hypothetical protein CgunFtcFv8_005850 [Champsocephalus gunnari]|uniref:Uncharacterized protein n=1 Tax=Champsocephalus gunnari TaxID=52237 RepID=A0AAN8D2B3_CHAGU|nr:hypothetical protein CgunFtcFv8_005850 [Champsocephalus gunnari]